MKPPDAKQTVVTGSSTEDLQRRVRKIQWTETGEDVSPYQASVNGENWVIRINDFPAEHLYTLIIDEQEAEEFDDWPSSWLRPEKWLRLDYANGVSVPSADDIQLSELVKSLRALAADSSERQARIEQIARSYASGVYRAAEEKAKRMIDEALRRRK